MDEGIVRHEYFLEPGHIYIGLSPSIVRLVLGSCVAVSLWEKELQLGGMNHFMYPYTGDPETATARYGNIAVPALVRMMIEEGARPDTLEAQIFGGAMLKDSVEPGVVGEKNVMIAHAVLKSRGIPVISEDVGGVQGRKIVFDTSNGKVAIIKVPRIREDDWFPDPDNVFGN